MNRGITYTGYYSQGLLLYSCMNRGVSYMGYYSRRVFFLSRGLKTTLSVYIYYIYIYYKACFWPRFAVVLCATNDVKYWNITGSKFRQTSLSLLIRRPTLYFLVSRRGGGAPYMPPLSESRPRWLSVSLFCLPGRSHFRLHILIFSVQFYSIFDCTFRLFLCNFHYFAFLTLLCSVDFININ